MSAAVAFHANRFDAAAITKPNQGNPPELAGLLGHRARCTCLEAQLGSRLFWRVWFWAPAPSRIRTGPNIRHSRSMDHAIPLLITLPTEPMPASAILTLAGAASLGNAQAVGPKRPEPERKAPPEQGQPRRRRAFARPAVQVEMPPTRR
jgi:hypothetical protein